MLRGRRERLHTHHALQHRARVRVPCRRGHDARAVDEVDAARERDVLPHLRLAGDGRDRAHLARLERVDHRALADVRVADEADGDLLLVGVQLGELAEELDERAFAEGVVGRGVEGERGVARGQVLDVAGLGRGCGWVLRARERRGLTVTQLGTRSHLLMTSTTCLCAFSLRTNSRTDSQRVPSGSRASMTWMITSEESMTLYSSP